MAFALWAVGGFIFVVYFGTLALQAAIWVLQVAIVLATWAVQIVAGVAAMLLLALFDRSTLRKVWREASAS